MTGISDAAPAPTPRDRFGWTEKFLVGLGMGGLAAVSWIYPATTRMYSDPWENILRVTLLIPPLLLLLRGRAAATLSLPRAWTMLALAAAGWILVSDLASPYRATALRNGAIGWSGIALFFVVLFWIQAGPTAPAARIARLQRVVGAFLAIMVFLSFASWLRTVPGTSFAALANGRNPYPLGHSNYTAGLALLMIATFAALAFYSAGRTRQLWWLLAALAVGLLFTTSSRGGWLGLGALALVALPQYVNVSRRALLVALAGAALLLAAGLWANPRTRGTFGGDALLQSSDLQRSAMLRGGWLLGETRPLFGWGTGAVPLAYPRFRGQLAGGAENVLQLHSTPPQLWAELGLGGILLAGGGVFLVLRAARQRAWRPALYPFFGYAVFSLTDWQGDVPVFVALFATGAASLAALDGGARPLLRFSRGTIAALALGLGALIAGAQGWVRPDPAPAWNTEALRLATTPAGTVAARALLLRSLAENPAQEIAHFNLGWLDVVDDPPSAAAHFRAAANLVPDKGGVYFGLGLALLNQGQSAAAAQAWALEALNDPAFLASPWRKNPRIRNLDTAFSQALRDAITHATVLAADRSAILAQLRYVLDLSEWIEHGTPVTSAPTIAQREFFARRPSPEPLTQAGIVAYHRERTGYPVLMRNLNLPPPTDIFLVQENALAARGWKFLFPEKGWLDNRLLLQLLPAPIAPIK